MQIHIVKNSYQFNDCQKRLISTGHSCTCTANNRVLNFIISYKAYSDLNPMYNIATQSSLRINIIQLVRVHLYTQSNVKISSSLIYLQKH